MVPPNIARKSKLTIANNTYDGNIVYLINYTLIFSVTSDFDNSILHIELMFVYKFLLDSDPHAFKLGVKVICVTVSNHIRYLVNLQVRFQKQLFAFLILMLFRTLLKLSPVTF